MELIDFFDKRFCRIDPLVSFFGVLFSVVLVDFFDKRLRRIDPMVSFFGIFGCFVGSAVCALVFSFHLLFQGSVLFLLFR